MAKNIVLCLDGTGNQIKAKGNSNVVNLYEMLDLSDPDRQVAFYDPGVGTFGAQGAWTSLGRGLTKLLGLTFGFGIKVNLAEAYTYLMQVYEPGDRVFVFGFSRGAYTSRALVGMSHRGGLMRRGAENLVNYLVSRPTPKAPPGRRTIGTRSTALPRPSPSRRRKPVPSRALPGTLGLGQGPRTPAMGSGVALHPTRCPMPG